MNLIHIIRQELVSAYHVIAAVAPVILFPATVPHAMSVSSLTVPSAANALEEPTQMGQTHVTLVIPYAQFVVLQMALVLAAIRATK